MTKKHIVAAVNAQGNVELELSGYAGVGCVEAEQKLRETLAAFGICVKIDALREKSLQECQQEASSDIVAAKQSSTQFRGEIV